MQHFRIERVIESALLDSNAHRASRELSRAISETEQSIPRLAPDQEVHARCLLSQASTVVAGFAATYAARVRARAKAVRYVQEVPPSQESNPKLAIQFAESVVNWGYDAICPPEHAVHQYNLALAWRGCRAALEESASKPFVVQLMAQRASVHRAQAAFHGRIDGKKFARHAIDVSRANQALHPNSALANVDLGLSISSLARGATTETDFFNLSQDAESYIRTAHGMGSTVASLSLSRFLRQSYRPLQALEVFQEFARRERKLRNIYAECQIAAEAAVLLLHRDIPEDQLRPTLTWVSELLSSAFEAGYTSARLLVPIARIRHYLGDHESSAYFLRELIPGGRFSWREAIAKAREAIHEQNTDHLRTAFALGLNDGHVWNSLGTYVRDIEADNDLALTLYDEAAQLSPTSAVIHTNIARLLLESQKQDDFPRIDRHLELARAYADFSFRWWRPLQNRFDQLRTGLTDATRSYPVRSGRESANRLYQEFLRLEQTTEEPHSRGQRFQDLFVRLLQLTFGFDRAAGSLVVGGAQSDASFFFSGNGYRVEISWDSKPNDRSEVEKLVSRLRKTAGSRGLLVSMSGFTSGVLVEIERDRGDYMLLTLDREELRSVLRGDSRLETLIEEKSIRHFLSRAHVDA